MIQNSSNRTLHRGTAESGAECGQQLRSSSWVRIPTANPVEAVLDYGCVPCTKCFDRVNELHRLYTIEHSATMVQFTTKGEIIESLPWNYDG